MVKKYKTQKFEQGAIQLNPVEFDGSYDELQQTLWEIAQPKIKGLARITNNVVELDSTPQPIDQISNFVIIIKNSRSYTFGDVSSPVISISNDLSNLTAKRGAEETLTTIIYEYSRNITKAGDYERVMASVTGGAAARDRSGAPNQSRFNDIIARLKELHPQLQGEDVIWSSWAGVLLPNQETLEEQIRLPPPPEVTLYFERQTQSEQQLHNVRHSLRIASELAKDQQDAIEDLMKAFEYSYLDLRNQLLEQKRNIKVYKRTISSVLNALTPIETASASSFLRSVENVNDDDHSNGESIAGDDNPDDWSDREE
ncbi:hypothetical protein BJ741DRAFT_618696 [Chytriomyces cf. hyalinus JEL632]|nr:hypothetical protein BJ741DRAFT_618696 [Chytriomyces cf. hyalinus JEL632]